VRIQALATDYDGTLAREGKVSRATVAAVEKVHESGRRLVLVTGRQLEDLLDVFPEATTFDMIVAENGAVLSDPKRGETITLAEPAPATFLQELERRHVPISAGRIVLATGRPHEVEVLQAIAGLGLEWEVIFNKGSVMALPSGTNKASGMLAALDRLGLSPHNVAGIGDAENDHSFLRLSEVAVAVGNALPAIKERADLVMRRRFGGGVTEFIDRYLLDDLQGEPQVFHRHDIVLGARHSGAPLRLPVYGAVVLILGASGSGKSTLSGVLIERLNDLGYQVCVVDPEGDHGGLDPLVVLGSARARPALDEVTLALRRDLQGVVVNLVAMSRTDRSLFAPALLSDILALRTTHGRPHWLIVDEAHHLLPASGAPSEAILPAGTEGVALITLSATDLAQSVLQTVTHLFVVGAGAGEHLQAFATARGLEMPPAGPGALDLMEGEALLATVEDSRLNRPVRFRVAPRRSEHQRHVRKYARGDLGADSSFYFRGPDGRLNLRAYNVHAFSEMARGVDLATWMYHLEHGDYSAWFERKVKDPETAERIRETEREASTLEPEETRRRVLDLVDTRYTAGE
jgi:hydroxymethylpyrimidine pyrophosphatase-like HAD family hydrolase